jgi:hypothetical protein
MPNLVIETGVKTFTINNDESRTITFSPTDYGFIKRLETAYEQLDAAQVKWAEAGKEATGDIHNLMDVIDGAEKEIRSLIDYAFAAPVSEVVFHGLSAYALAGGAPLWANFLLAVFDECDAEFTAQEKASNPRLQKLLKKYGKKK